MKYDFPRVSRARLFEIDKKSTVIGDGKTTDPTEEEMAWLNIMKLNTPDVERLKRKLAVCADAEVVEYAKDFVTILYDGIKYTMRKPTNGLRIARAREYRVMDALEELNNQHQILIGLAPLPKDFSGIDADVITILAKVAENFFFVPYL